MVHYYRTKADLFTAVVEDRFAGFLAEEEALLARHHGCCRDLLEQLLRRLWDHLWEPGIVELGMVVKAERPAFPEATRTLFRELGERWQRLLELVLDAGARRGEFRWHGPHAARVLSRAVTGIVESSRCFCTVERCASEPEELWRALMDLIDHGVLASAADAHRTSEGVPA